MERLTTGATGVRSGLDVRIAEPVEPARKDPRGSNKSDLSSKDELRAFEALDIDDQVAAIEKMRETVSALEYNRLKIDRHEESGQFIYRIFNEDTGETIRRWPPQSYLDLMVFLRDGYPLVNERA